MAGRLWDSETAGGAAVSETDTVRVLVISDMPEPSENGSLREPFFLGRPRRDASPENPTATVGFSLGRASGSTPHTATPHHTRVWCGVAVWGVELTVGPSRAGSRAGNRPVG